jgi:hypothetical protein
MHGSGFVHAQIVRPAVKGRSEEAEEAMRNRSTIDMIVEDAVRELEYELESEVGVEFQSRPPLPKFYKWVVYTSTSMSGDWRCNREDSPQRMMQLSEARSYGEALLKRLAPIVGPLDLRVGFQRYVWDGNAWNLDLGQCRQIEVLTKRIAACDGVPPKNC